ncbi:N-acetylglucosaminyl-phosphatidylinositol de-N-acetylase [[Candida] railenensis]|uniref:N-acetylglucosaminylphosphatidylinositol deacetylase n=1 Tax=[Candida] railenensis TaxID=45579 RepID=A0A9P0VWI9_9ASCO|nr:N-acetylglucosaminyl-phosphatidylinositol de-N-acetylase [[Candida] railenensis]
MLNIFQWVIRLLATSFVIWVVLSTIVPQTIVKYSNAEVQSNKFQSSLYPYASLLGPSLIQNSTVYFVIGHPDDEVMFFAPSLIELSKAKNNNNVKIICFSNGDALDPSMGPIRSEELKSSSRILGVKDSDVLVIPSGQYKDGMNINWEADDIAKSLSTHIVTPKDEQTRLVVVTFDENGVSGHPNHISLYHGVRHWYRKNYTYSKKILSPSSSKQSPILYGLKSLNFWEKYSFTLLTNVELFVEHLSKLLISNILKFNVNISFFSSSSTINSSPEAVPTIMIYSDLNMLSVSYAAMSYGHFSQMVWFRYGWLLFSRYLTFNQLIPI